MALMTPKRGRNKVGRGKTAQLPSITSPQVSPGDIYYADDAGTRSECTLDATGAKQWTTTTPGQGVQTGSTALVAGTKTINAGVTITASSKIFVTRQGAPGGGTAIGLLNVRAVTPGAPGVGSFIIEALAEVNQAVVAADTSTVVYMIVG